MEWARKGWIILWTKFLLFVAVSTKKNQQVQDVGLIACTAKLLMLDVELRTAEVKELIVECPRSCLDDNYCYVIGSGPYTETSSVCCAAIHSGALNNNEGGRVLVNINYVAVSQFFESTKNNVTTRSQYRASPVTFELERVQTQTKTTTRPTTSLSILSTTTTKASLLHNIIDTVQPLQYSQKAEVSRSSTTTTEKITRLSANAPMSTHAADGYDVTVKTEKTTETVLPTQETTTHVVKNNTIMDPFVEKICLGIGAFLAGAVCVSLLVCLRRKKKKRRQRRCGGKFSNGTQRSDEGDVCVCYQNLNSSKQGLLYDPETCDRPCPIRQSNQDEVFVSKASLMSEKEIKKSSKRAKLEIACEDTKCKDECSGACNPALYDF